MSPSPTPLDSRGLTPAPDENRHRPWHKLTGATDELDDQLPYLTLVHKQNLKMVFLSTAGNTGGEIDVTQSAKNEEQ